MKIKKRRPCKRSTIVEIDPSFPVCKMFSCKGVKDHNGSCRDERGYTTSDWYTLLLLNYHNEDIVVYNFFEKLHLHLKIDNEATLNSIKLEFEYYDQT